MQEKKNMEVLKNKSLLMITSRAMTKQTTLKIPQKTIEEEEEGEE